MAKLTIETEVSKEAYELAQGLGKFAVAIRDAVKDGWQTGEDLPLLVASALTDLVPSAAGAEKLGDEAKEDPFAFGKAFALAGTDIAQSFIPKDDETPSA